MEDVIIVGAGGFGREVEWLINRINNISKTKKWNILGYADDGVAIGTVVGNSKVINNTDELLNIKKSINIVIAIGKPLIREKIYNKLKTNTKLKFPNIIDPNAILGDVSCGIGNIICAGTIATINIKLGDFNIINLDCTLGHDDVLNSFITVYPSVNISGEVKIENNVELGTGTQIIQGKNIVSNVIIGAGAVVVKDIVESGTYIGVPVKKIK